MTTTGANPQAFTMRRLIKSLSSTFVVDWTVFISDEDQVVEAGLGSRSQTTAKSE